MRLPTRLLRRKADSHKGDFGHVFIIAGSARYSGAAVLAAEGCLRSGAGLVTLGIPESINSAVIKIKPKEVMTLPLAQTKEATLGNAAYSSIVSFCKKVDIIAIGPGLSQNRQTKTLARKLIAGINKPMVIDADGLNALAGQGKLLEKISARAATTVLTPHPGEMAGLIGKTPGWIQKNRKKVAKDLTRRYNVILVLKGHHTIVAEKAKALYVNKTGNPGMAKGGSGDVLTGIIAAFLSQGLSGFQAACAAVYLHGVAGDLAAKEKTQLGMTAQDIVDNIPAAIKKCS